MKPGDFVKYGECVEKTGIVERPGRITEIIGHAVHVSLFDGSQWVVGSDHVRPIALEAAYRAIEEETARVEARAADRVRALRAESRAAFERALKAGR